MIRHASLFSQLISIFDRSRFHKLVADRKAEKYAKGFSCWDQFVAMLFCQLAQAKSLREICGGLSCCAGKLRHLGVRRAPNKSTLSYANTHRPWQLFQDMFYQTLDHVRMQAPEHRFKFKNKLLSMDSSTISLCLSLFPWAKFRRTKGAVKLHMLLDHDGYLPAYVYITNGKRHEVTTARHVPLAPGSIVAMDRGYNDYGLYSQWTRDGIYFVTRLKDNADYEVLEQRKVPQRRSVLSDELIRLSSLKARKVCQDILRRVVVWDKVNECEIVLLTNHLDFGATTIAAIYKERWQIELFFKALKQNLKVKTFVGTSENALYIQIWTALIAMLLIKYLKFKSRFDWSLSNLVAFLRWNLFTYRNLWEWIDKPYDVLPIAPKSVQDLLPLRFGQHREQFAT
ncbi:MAG: IS4 family transposase [Pseudomonadota bacterium]